MTVVQSFFFLFVFFLCLFNYACVPLNAQGGNNPVVSAPGESGDSLQSSAEATTDDLDRLADLWKRRTYNVKSTDYPIGPGDELEISVPGLPELTQSKLRISGEGAIALPYVGVVHAAGLTEEELSREIRRRLEKDYMHEPQVSLYVREYRSRQVAILGAVQKPGLYSLTAGGETLLDAVSLAGGMTKDAASRIHFIPAEPVEKERAREIMRSLPAEQAGQSLSPLVLTNLNPIVVDLENLARGGNQIYLTVPARPGDVIMVPGSGEVLVAGWVARTGSYKITPGLTVLGAVAAAGGSTFAADTSAVKILRTTRKGEKVSLWADLERIKSGEKPDIPVIEGDVVEVPSSAPMLVVHGFYRLFSSIVHIGANIPLF